MHKHNQKGVTFLKSESYSDFIQRWNNFHIDRNRIKEIIDEDTFLQLYDLLNHIITDFDKTANLEPKQVLQKSFNIIYDFIIQLDSSLSIFNINTNFYQHIHDACFFTVLSLFLFHSNRIPGKSLRRFVYDNSTAHYNQNGSRNYFDFENSSDDNLLNEESTFRKMRHRILSNRNIYIKRPEWSAMSADAESEWAFYYTLTNLNDTLRDTYKRLGNLYNDVNRILELSGDSDYSSKANSAYQKFLSKLHKIKYENYLDLLKNIVKHICQNKDYYGLNIYRFEKEMRAYNITHEVTSLINCKNESERQNIIVKSYILSNIFFPKLYKDFSLLDLSDTIRYTLLFDRFMAAINNAYLLVIDELIDSQYLGKNWDVFLRNTINDLTNQVFYDPQEIDYTILPESQTLYEELLSSAVHIRLFGYLSSS